MDRRLNSDHFKERKARKHDGELIIRIITYNVHSCVNLNGTTSPQKIAQVLSRFDPDLIALQEVDADKTNKKNQNQAKIIAEKLKMDHIFFPVENKGIHLFGLAILSRFAFKEVYMDWLPNLYPKLKPRKRGAIRAKLQTPLGPIHFFNTHLSLFKLERRKQMNELLSKNWLSAVPEDEPIVFCGDLNAGPLSAVYRKLSRGLMDVQKSSQDPRFPSPTFHSRRPAFRIDHIFVSKHFRIDSVDVPKTPETLIASDHLPLYVKLAIRNDERQQQLLQELPISIC